ncbi:MAG: CRISPR-associated protein Csx15 [Bacteroidota bacterium]
MTKRISFNNAVVLTNEGTNMPLTLDLQAPLTNQVTNHLARLVDSAPTTIIPVGQPTAGAIMLAACHRLLKDDSLKMGFFEFGTNKYLGDFPLLQWRNDVVRKRRSELDSSAPSERWVVLDCLGKGVTDEQLSTIERQLGVFEIQSFMPGYHLGAFEDLRKQADEIVDTIISEVNHAYLHGQRVAIIPPGSSQVSALIATALYGLTEIWPTLIHRPRTNEGFVVKEIIDLQLVRQEADKLLAGEIIATSKENTAATVEFLTELGATTTLPPLVAKFLAEVRPQLGVK